MYLDEPSSIADIVWRFGASPLEAIVEMRSQDVLWVRDVWHHWADVEAMQGLVAALVLAPKSGASTRGHMPA